ncbi:MAG: PAS domain S-box protein, partial [Methanoregula sp.]|nr:PAS domain S-box protein [Methanoregula sp.]
EIRPDPIYPVYRERQGRSGYPGDRQRVDFYIQKGGEPVAQYAELAHKIRLAVERYNLNKTRNESEERFRSLVQNSTDIIRIINADGYIVYDFPSSTRILGYPPGFTIGKKSTEFIHPDDQKHVQDALEEVYNRTNPGTPTEFRVRKADGSYIFVETIAANCIGMPGIDGIVTTTRVIEERKKYEMAQKKSEVTFRTVFEYSPVGMATCGPEGRIIDVNPAFERMLMFTHGELCNRSFLEFTHPDDRMLELPLIEKAMAKDIGPCEIEKRFIRKDGQVIWVRLIASLIHGHDGAPSFGIAHIEDITDRKNTENALRESEERFRGLVDTVTSGVAIYEVSNDGAFGKDYIIKDFNKKALEIEGKTKVEVVGKSLFDLRPTIDDYGLIPVFRQVWETGVPAYFPEKVYIDEKYISWYENRVFRLQSGEIVAVYDDITVRKQAEEALRESEEKYHTVADFTYDWEYWIAPDGKFIYVSPSCERITGYRPEEFIRDPDLFIKIVHNDDRDRIIDHLFHKESSHCGEGAREFRIVSRSGEERWIGHECQPVYGRNGEYRGNRGSNRDITGRKRSEEELRRSEGRLHTLVQTIPDLIWLKNKDGVYLACNSMFERFFGARESEIVGKTDYDFLDPELADFFREHDRKAVEAGGPTSNEEWITFADDDHRALLDTIKTPMYDAEGTLIGVLGIGRDITGRKVIEAALRASEERFHSMFERHDSVMLLIRPETGKIIDANLAAERFYGRSRDELCTRSIDEINVLSPEEVSAEMNRAVREQNNFFTFPHRLANGEIRTVEVHSSPIDIGGEIVLFSIINDITGRRRAEEAVRESHQILEAIINTIPVRVFWKGKDLTYIGCNTSFARDAGFEKTTDVIGKDDYRMSWSEQAGIYHAADRLIIESGTPKFLIEEPQITPSGEPICLLMSKVPLKNTTGEIIGVLGTYVDITERKLAEEALVAANRKLTLLSSITRHDINNQLTVLVGYLQILEKKQQDSSFTEYFKKINAAAERISAMIRFTSEYEDIGISTPAWQDCRTLVDTAAKQAPLGKVMVKNDLPDGTEVFADPLVFKVFYNLMDNAVRYGGKITNIRFSAMERDDNFVVICEDDGDGVPEDEKEKIFERGFGKNTGLGLAMSREILSITGITITETGEPGQGARFEMLVPKEALK